MAKCKSCGAEIIWVKTAGGNRMPCDPDLIVYWERSGATGKIVTPNGSVLSCDFDGDPQTATGIGYVPHWATCPYADTHRKKRTKSDQEQISLFREEEA